MQIVRHNQLPVLLPDEGQLAAEQVQLLRPDGRLLRGCAVRQPVLRRIQRHGAATLPFCPRGIAVAGYPPEPCVGVDNGDMLPAGFQPCREHIGGQILGFRHPSRLAQEEVKQGLCALAEDSILHAVHLLSPG